MIINDSSDIIISALFTSDISNHTLIQIVQFLTASTNCFYGLILDALVAEEYILSLSTIAAGVWNFIHPDGVALLLEFCIDGCANGTHVLL